jgi:hypothetical protein
MKTIKAEGGTKTTPRSKLTRVAALNRPEQASPERVEPVEGFEVPEIELELLSEHDTAHG